MSVLELYAYKSKDGLSGLVLAFAKLFDFTRFFNPPEAEYSNLSDAEILRSDWETLNKDMWISFDKVKNETTISSAAQ